MTKNQWAVVIITWCLFALGVMIGHAESKVSAKESDTPQYLQKLPNGSYLMRYSDPHYNTNCYLVVGTIERMGHGGSSAPVDAISCVPRSK